MHCVDDAQISGSSMLAGPASKTSTDSAGSSLILPAAVRPAVCTKREPLSDMLRDKPSQNHIHLHLNEVSCEMWRAIAD